VAGAQFVVARAPNLDDGDFRPVREGSLSRVAVVEGETDTVLASADVALTASGTATVQAALHDTPMVIVYRVSPMTYRLGHRLVRVDTFGMVNLIAEERLVPELIQDELTPEAVAREAVSMLTDRSRTDRIRAGLARVRQRLGGPGASRRAAEAIVRLILALLVLLAPCRPAAATVLVSADLSELSHEARVIARGVVLATDVQWTGDWRSIETLVTLHTEAALKGSPGTLLRFRVPGGQVGRYLRYVVGAPRLVVGQRVVVFLGGPGTGDPYILGLGQGLFRIVAGTEGPAVAPPPTPSVNGAAQPLVRGDPARRSMPLDEFERRVRALAGGAP
jgi:hypothetical protein